LTQSTLLTVIARSGWMWTISISAWLWRAGPGIADRLILSGSRHRCDRLQPPWFPKEIKEKWVTVNGPSCPIDVGHFVNWLLRSTNKYYLHIH
jgi:hypothetical protein